MFKLLSILIFMILGVILLSIIPPYLGLSIGKVELTRTSIGETLYRIHLYAKEHSKMPDSLVVLPIREGYANSTTDGWGNILIYDINDGYFELYSLGKDGTYGGVGENEDIIKKYRFSDKHGNFIADNDLWVVNAEVKHEP